MLRGHACVSALIAFFCLSTSSLHAAVTTQIYYQLTDIGFLTGASGSGAGGLNDQGMVVGTSGNRAFRWTAQTGIQEVGVPSGYVSADANDVNASGQIALTAHGSDSTNVRAFRWTSGTFTRLFTVGGPINLGLGIDSSGRVTGSSWTSISNFQIHAYRSDAASSNTTDINSLGGDSSVGYAINASGQVVGQASTSGGQTRAFLWNGSGNMIDLGSLGGATTYSEAKGISDSGIIVGDSITDSGILHAFIWQNGLMTDLGSLADRSYGYAVNNSGQVIGNYIDGFYSHPYIWDAEQGMQDLDTLLDPAAMSDGWAINDLSDINNSGQIAATATIDGITHAVLLTPVPEPGACLTGLFACLIVGSRRTRS